MRKLVEQVQRALPMWLSAEDAILALVAALPGRHADGVNVQAMAARLRASPAGLESLVAELLRAPATLERHVPPLLAQRLGAPSQTAFVSLGAHCFSASFLRRWGLREWSGPFDWLFSSAAMVTHCIEDDFATFLDRSQYEPVPPDARPHGPNVNRTHHRLYRQMFGIEFIFNHHDPLEDDIYAHFTRSVDRFRRALADPRPKTFLLTRTQSEGPIDDLSALDEALSKRCRDYRLCVFETPPGLPTPTPSPQLKPLVSEGRLQVCEFRPCSHWGPMQFDDLLDEHTLLRYMLAGGAVPRAEAVSRQGAHT